MERVICREAGRMEPRGLMSYMKESGLDSVELEGFQQTVCLHVYVVCVDWVKSP